MKNSGDHAKMKRKTDIREIRIQFGIPYEEARKAYEDAGCDLQQALNTLRKASKQR